MLGHQNRRYRRHWDPKRPDRFDISHWRTREVLELLVLAHAVNNQALIKILREKCALRFANEEDIFDVNYADEEDDTSRRQSDVTAKRQLFKFDCKRDRLCRLASFLALIWATKTPGSCKVEVFFSLLHVGLRAESRVFGGEEYGARR